MLELFVCCAPEDRDTAAAIATRLERQAEISVVVEEAATTIPAAWEEGLSSSAILLLLSRHAVPSGVSRSEWGGLLDHLTGPSKPPLASLLLQDCAYPRLLERGPFFRWQGDGTGTLRSLEEWALRLHPLPGQRSFSPAPLPWFEAPGEELEVLWKSLVDAPGTAFLVSPAPSGKTALAQEFARLAGGNFRDVFWVPAGRSPAAIAGDLADQLGTGCETDAGPALTRLLELAGEHRVLLILDGLEADLGGALRSHGRASVLATTRLEWHRTPGSHVFQVHGRPEIPLSAPRGPGELQLWQAMAVCSPGGFPLALAAKIAEMDASGAAQTCERLVAARLADPLDNLAQRFRLNAPSRELASTGLEPHRERHAQAIQDAFAHWTTHPAECRACAAELAPALDWAFARNWPLAVSLARHAFGFLRNQRRMAEGAELLTWLRDAAERHQDWRVSDECSWELSWIRGVPYRSPDRSAEPGAQLSFQF